MPKNLFLASCLLLASYAMGDAVTSVTCNPDQPSSNVGTTFCAGNVGYGGASASASASQTILKAQASASITGNPAIGGAETDAFASAQMGDLFTIGGAGPRTGSLVFTITADGISTLKFNGPYGDTHNSYDVASLSVNSSSTIAFNYGNSYVLDGSGALNTLQVIVPYEFGAAQVTIGLGASARCIVYGPSTDCNANVDFSQTARITGLQVLDTNGNVVTGATITTGSGTDYNASAVPEPSSLLLLSSTTFALIPKLRRFKGGKECSRVVRSSPVI